MINNGTAIPKTTLPSLKSIMMKKKPLESGIHHPFKKFTQIGSKWNSLISRSPRSIFTQFQKGSTTLPFQDDGNCPEHQIRLNNARKRKTRVDKCLTRQDYTDALSNVPATGTDQNYDEFVYSKNNADKLMEYEWVPIPLVLFFSIIIANHKCCITNFPQKTRSQWRRLKNCRNLGDVLLSSSDGASLSPPKQKLLLKILRSSGSQ